eukprot:4480627-Ditylum_brightwellii.AAC.1
MSGLLFQESKKLAPMKHPKIWQWLLLLLEVKNKIQKKNTKANKQRRQFVGGEGARGGGIGWKVANSNN